MLTPVRFTPLPGLFLAALPLLAMGSVGLALPPLLGGGAEVWRMAGAPGLYSVLMWLGIGGVTLVLSTLLCRGSAGRHAPLVLLVGLATLPWLLGIAGTQEAMRRVLAALPEVGGRDALAMLAAGTGEAMVTRRLGAWTSAALLGAVAVGLVLVHKHRRAGEDSERMLGAALALVLGFSALLAALEAHLLVDLLTPRALPDTGDPAARLATDTSRLTSLQELRWALLGALTVLGLALVGWRFFPRPRAVAQWAGSLTLMAIAAAVLALDTRPLQLAAWGAWRADASHMSPSSRLPHVLAGALGAVPAAHCAKPAVRTGP
ncbi:hypothetical protein F0U62_05340 [Cystobacter fuscus]|uniref:hypothetical protein n=1 Tax=Cystobacter fuscus TaxID=43 RepID=UPI002B2C4AFC|nr:hypothetical protein F0U62_05340 [Cystobacter fuscus]